MRKNFAQVLTESKIDIKSEYSKLYNLLYGKFYDNDTRKQTSVYEKYSDSFTQMWFRGTALSLEEFDEENGFIFEEQPNNFGIDYLVSFCEYFYNLNIGYMSVVSFMSEINTQIITEQIDKVISLIGYMPISQDGFTVFVEQSQSAIAVSEIIDDSNLSYKTIYYNHHSMQGDLEGKKEILLKFASYIEPKSKILYKVDPTLKNDLFYLFNNLNIRHNNIDMSNSKNYKKYVSKMSFEQTEEWYDETYQMCLLAILEIEHCERKKKFDELKQNIETV